MQVYLCARLVGAVATIGRRRVLSVCLRIRPFNLRASQTLRRDSNLREDEAHRLIRGDTAREATVTPLQGLSVMWRLVSPSPVFANLSSRQYLVLGSKIPSVVQRGLELTRELR